MKTSIFLTLAACGGMLFAANDAKAQEAVVVEESLNLTEFDTTPHYYNTWRDGWFQHAFCRIQQGRRPQIPSHDCRL